MTRQKSKTFNVVLMRLAISTALLAMMLSASACGKNTRGPILLAPNSAFCARYADADHPPVWIYESDSVTEKEEKTDLLILWERECSITDEV